MPVRDLVWGAVLTAVGLIVGIATLIGSNHTAIVVLLGLTTALGLARIARGATRYPWKDESSDLWTEGAALLRDRGALPAVGLLTLLSVYTYSNMFGGELVGDDLTFHMAEARRIADCLAVGDWDLWNPSANASFASAYYYQVIPQLASAIPAAIFGHFTFFFQLSNFLPLVLQPALAYRGMRLLGATPWQAFVGAALIALMNGESRWGHGNAGTFQVGLYTQTWALAFFPLALGHCVRWLGTGAGLAPATAWSAFVFLCHPFAGIGLGFTLFIGWVAARAANGIDALFKLLFAGMRTQEMDTDGPIQKLMIAAARRWQAPPKRPPARPEFVRLLLLGVTFVIASIPLLAPFVIDKAGFGGFPHRVPDEVGPGFGTLATWWTKGSIMDHGSPLAIITWSMPVVLLFARAPWLRWLWWPAFTFALLLGLGPHLPTTQNDLFPAVRFLGAMQATLALAIGAGACVIGARIWRAAEGSLTFLAARIGLLVVFVVGVPLLARYAYTAPLHAALPNIIHRITFRRADLEAAQIIGLVVVILLGGAVIYAVVRARSQYALRTSYAALAAAMATFLAFNATDALKARVWVLPQYANNHRAELLAVAAEMERLPEGRKQVGPGSENHWWNLLTYVYGRRPALVQYGGGGLQASPNYDFLWHNGREYGKLAYLYDAPYLVFGEKSAGMMPIGETLFRTEHYELRRIRGSSIISPITIVDVLPEGEIGAGTEVRKKALEWMKTDLPMTDKFYAYAGSGPPGPVGDGKIIRAWRQQSPGDDADLVAETESTTPTTFVARESWHPRWHAYIDGNEATIRRVTPDFPAIDVPAGKHTITFRFERPWWATASWLLWPGVVIVAWRVTRKKRPRPLPIARAVT